MSASSSATLGVFIYSPELSLALGVGLGIGYAVCIAVALTALVFRRRIIVRRASALQEPAQR